MLPYYRHLPDLKAVVQYRGSPAEPWVVSWDRFLRLGEAAGDAELSARLAGQAINQPALVCYTSGTTANAPKGALLSQDNITWTCRSAREGYGLAEGREEIISYLPASHIVPNMCDVWLFPSIAGTVHFADRSAVRGSFMRNLAETRPTMLITVPRVLERIQAVLEEQLDAAAGDRR